MCEWKDVKFNFDILLEKSNGIGYLESAYEEIKKKCFIKSIIYFTLTLMIY